MHVPSRKRSLGFTLIECVITLLIVSIISVVTSRILIASFNSFSVDNAINSLSNQALIGLTRITYDLRSATGLTSIASNALTFADQTGTSVTYSLSGSLLQRGSYTLLDSVQSIVFAYLDINGNVAATASAVDYVKITLSLTSATIPVSYTTVVYLRGINK